MKHFFLLIFILSFGIISAQYQLIPQPQKIELRRGQFIIPDTLFISSKLPIEESNYLINRLKGKLEIVISNSTESQIHTTQMDTVHPEEWYSLVIRPEGINISFSSNEGYFRSLQTLAQLFEEHLESGRIPAMTIDDEPKFKWRGMHLDVVRHFFTVDEVKKYLDYLAMYKINTFHWHLTDDQGWRIEIKKYPKLTEIGSKRKESMIGPYVDNQFDGTPYSGFYTQEEIKEVVQYAAKLHINIVPEIEMPGHAVAALTAYPELSCTGGPFEVETKWGVFDDIFCPKEGTFEFLENVLSEVMELFPSPYIHIGGDEAPKTRWKECPHCQALIKQEGLKDEHELQSYFIKRIEKFVNSKGRKIIGWNEILEGGLAPNAAVMSWTGVEGGIEAAITGHFAVMTPGNYLYFDHYQGDSQSEPLAFGGNNTLEKVYSYHPIPKELTQEEEKFILGVQANLWTEYIPDFKQVEYMLFPRLMALSEVAWGTSEPEKYAEFESKVIRQFKLLDERNIRYARSIYNLNGKVIQNEKGIVYELTTNRDPKGIRYTTDGTEPTASSLAYLMPIPIDKSVLIQAAYFEKDELKSAISKKEFHVSKSTGKNIVLKDQPAPNYSSNGALTLVDGILGDPKILGQTWLGFSGKNLEALIDFGEKTAFETISFNSLNNKGSWIHLAKEAKIFISKDGKKFKKIKTISHQEIIDNNGRIRVNTGKQSSRYLKIVIDNAGIIPAGNSGAGSEAWLFVDEIGVL